MALNPGAVAGRDGQLGRIQNRRAATCGKVLGWMSVATVCSPGPPRRTAAPGSDSAPRATRFLPRRRGNAGSWHPSAAARASRSHCHTPGPSPTPVDGRRNLPGRSNHPSGAKSSSRYGGGCSDAVHYPPSSMVKAAPGSIQRRRRRCRVPWTCAHKWHRSPHGSRRVRRLDAQRRRRCPDSMARAHRWDRPWSARRGMIYDEQRNRAVSKLPGLGSRPVLGTVGSTAAGAPLARLKA